MDLFWDEEIGVWFDLSQVSKSKRKKFYPSNIFPLFVGCYTDDGTSRVESNVLKYLQVRTNTKLKFTDMFSHFFYAVDFSASIYNHTLIQCKFS